MFKLDVFDMCTWMRMFFYWRNIVAFFYDEKQLCMVSTNSSPRGIVCDVFEGVFWLWTMKQLYIKYLGEFYLYVYIYIDDYYICVYLSCLYLALVLAWEFQFQLIRLIGNAIITTSSSWCIKDSWATPCFHLPISLKTWASTTSASRDH